MIRTCLSPSIFSTTKELEPVFIEVRTDPNYSDKPSARVRIERTSKSRMNIQHGALVLETTEETQILIEMLTAFLAEKETP